MTLFKVIIGLAGAAVCSGMSGCSRNEPREQRARQAPDASAASSAGEKLIGSSPEPAQLMTGSAPWTVQRVGGDMDAQVLSTDAGFRFGTMLIDTPLPVGYPGPTPPGAIELKKYPSVRRAEASGGSSPDIGMNMAFFPLFNHIKRRNIEMTSPVEMDYHGQSSQDRKWTMSFLYREPGNGPTGADRSIQVVDTRAMTVLAIGMRGRYSRDRVAAEAQKLEAWLAEHPEWKRAGDLRALYYNGPDRKRADQWSEAQIPVEPASDR